MASGETSTAQINARLRPANFVRQSALVFSGSIVLSACGFLYHAIASRRLGVETYGALYAAISAVAIAGIPGAVLQPVIARFAAEFGVLHDERHMAGLARSVVIGFGTLSILFVAFAFAGAGPVAHFLQVPRWTVPMMGAIAALVLLATGLRAIAQGTQDFATFAGSNVVEGVGKVVAVFVLASLGLAGGLIGFLAGPALAFAFLALIAAGRYGRIAPEPVRYDWRRIAATIGGSAVGTATMSIIGFADVILVKHYFDAAHAGVYAAASLGGKMLLFVVGFIPTVLLPQAAYRHFRGESSRAPLLAGLGGVVLISFGGLATFALFGKVILHALVGVQFDAAVTLLVPYGAAMALLAMVNALVTFGIATHRLSFAAPLAVCTAGTVAAIALVHPTLYAVVMVLVAGTATMAIVTALALLWDSRRVQRARPAPS